MQLITNNDNWLKGHNAYVFLNTFLANGHMFNMFTVFKSTFEMSNKTIVLGAHLHVKLYKKEKKLNKFVFIE